MKIQKPKLLLHSSAVLLMVAGSFANAKTANADHNYNVLRAKADAVFHATVALDRTLVDSYVQSRVFGEIMACSARIKAKALYLRGMAWHGSPCRWAAEINELDRQVCKLEAKIQRAHYRAEQGLDPPISFCAIEAGRRLAAIRDLVRCMQDALVVAARPPAPPVCYGPPAGQLAPVYPRPGQFNQSFWNYGGYNSHRGYGSGSHGYGKGFSVGHSGLGFRFNF